MTGMVLTRASREWSSRKPDERFPSIAAIHENAVNAKKHAEVVTDQPVRDLEVIEQADDLYLTRGAGRLKMTNFSFAQLCARAKIGDDDDATAAPAGYLSKLPAGLAAQCLNEGLRNVVAQNRDAQVSMLLDNSAGRTLRALTSTRYGRIFDADITSRLVRLEEEGPWQPAPAAFDGSRGLYRGDRDMFCFMVDSNRRIFETLPGGGLSRGFFTRNSEVGAAAFEIWAFLYEYCCGNHRVWGVQQLDTVSVRHVGAAAARATTQWGVTLRRYAEGSASEEEAKIQSARDFVIGATKADILDVLFKLRDPGLTKGLITKAAVLAETREDWYGNPRSAWAMGGAITEIARDMPNADERFAADKAGKRVLEMAF